VEDFLNQISNSTVRTIGPELIFGTLFDRLGFSIIKEDLFRHLVIARLAYPTSKLKTVDYLYRYQGTVTSPSTVYRFLDTLNEEYKTKVETIAYQYTKNTLKTITVIFYDLTTLYFETEDEDDLRKIGFSKDGKFKHPQIRVGLLVGKDGLPIGYDIFEGNTFEGKTLIPTLEKLEKQYNLGKPTVIADSGLLSKENLELLKTKGYQFIIGARIKNESDLVKDKILKQATDLKDKDSFVIKKDDTRLIVTYADNRAKKDKHNRQRGLKKLKQKVQFGKLTKEHINSRGYNKFLTMVGETKVTINEVAIEKDKLWDGLKGYVTNTRLSPKTIIEQYSHLWQIERAFRISKTDLRIRPIHHYLRRRIEAHICIAFVAYTIYKELERLLKKHNLSISAKRASELTHTMYALDYTLPHSKQKRRTVLNMDDEQRGLYDVIRSLRQD